MKLDEAKQFLKDNGFVLNEKADKMTVYSFINVLNGVPEDYVVKIANQSVEEIYSILDKTYDETFDKTVFLCSDRMLIVHDSKNMDVEEVFWE